MNSPTWRVALAAALAPTVWGTTYLVVAELLPPGRPLLAALLRALPAGLVLLAATRTLPRGEWWWRSLVLGGLNIGLFFSLLFIAAYRLPGGVAATLGAISPLVATGLGAVLLGERARPAALAAGAAGVLGVALLVLDGRAALDPVGVGAGLLGALVMALGLVLTRRWQPPVGLLASTSWQLLGGAVVLLPLTWVIEGLPLASLTATNLAGYAWLSTVGTAGAYLVWFRGVQRLPVSRSSVLGLLSPLVATGVGWAVLDEVLTTRQAGGALLVLLAVLAGQLAGTSRRRTRPETRPGTRPGRAAPAATATRRPALLPAGPVACVQGAGRDAA